MTGPSRQPLLEAHRVTRHFDVRSGFGRRATVRAVEDATITLHHGEIVAVVGESGSGKTTLARLLSMYYSPTEGEIRLKGSPVRPGQKSAKGYQSQVQMIFQDPFGSLNSMRRVRHNIERALQLHGHAARSRAARRAQVIELLERVNLTPAEQFIDKLPHELSGGQRQRVVIARALAVQPIVLLGDEPISMLDVSIRLDMLNLLNRLRHEEGVALLYITHDIASARYLSDRIYVMYAGQIIESGPTEEVIQRPKHPYTQLLLESTPDPRRRSDQSTSGTFDDVDALGEPPSLINPPDGCRFHPRCPFVRDECRVSFPPRTDFASGQWTNCWLHSAPGEPTPASVQAPGAEHAGPRNVVGRRGGRDEMTGER